MKDRISVHSIYYLIFLPLVVSFFTGCAESNLKKDAYNLAVYAQPKWNADGEQDAYTLSQNWTQGMLL
jgi:hypothetical protein